MGAEAKTPSSGLSWAILAALPLALSLTVLSELVGVLLSAEAVDASVGFGVVGEIGAAVLRRGWPFIAMLAAQAALVRGAEKRPSQRVWFAGGVLLLSLGHGLFAHHLLTVDTHMGPFVTFWVLKLGFGALFGLVLAARMVWGLPRLTIGFGVFFLVVAWVIWSVNYDWLPDVYLPAESFVFIVLLCLAIGAALLARTTNSRRRLAVAGSVPLVIVFVAMAAPRGEVARSQAYLFSAACRAAIAASAVAAEGTLLWPTERRTRSLEPDPDGVARFARQSALPELPPGFSLSDYDVLLVVSETFRMVETTLESPEDDTTPKLAAFGEDALVYTAASSPSISSFPSMSAVLSMSTLAFEPVEILPHFTTGRLSEDAYTVPEALGDSGYRTFWSGHNGGVAFTTYMLGLQQGFDETFLFEMGNTGTDDHDVVEAAVGAIRAHREADERYFGMVFFQAPHDPYRVHDPDAPSETALDRYRQELRFVDDRIAEVLEEATRDGGLERTVVIVMGDHGEAFGEHRVKYHSSNVHREQAHVPLVIRVPGLAPDRIDAPTSTTFVLPWLLASGPEPAKGAAERAMREDFGPLLRETEGAVLVEVNGHRHLRAALRYPTHTVLYDLLGDVIRVYDVERDPTEQHDLAPLDAALRRRFLDRARAYRRARFAGQRFIFIDAL